MKGFSKYSNTLPRCFFHRVYYSSGISIGFIKHNLYIPACIIIFSLFSLGIEVAHAEDVSMDALLKLLQSKGLIAQEDIRKTKQELEDEINKFKPNRTFPLEVSYRDGICFHTPEQEQFSLTLGTLLQVDYRYFDYSNIEDPANDKFDIRRAWLFLEGGLSKYFKYKFQYEFQGIDSRNLQDAYVDLNLFPFLSLKMGQFKEPFGLEQLAGMKSHLFAGNSIAYYLAPGRDVGLMAHSSLWKERINYGIGLFNGDGKDNSTGGDVDDPQLTGRVALSPFASKENDYLKYLQFGGSFSISEIDRNNVNLTSRTTGLTEFFIINYNTKFGVIRDADTQERYGAELGWACGPFAALGEYVQLNFSDIRTSSKQFDLKIDDAYLSFILMLTGEKPSFKNSVFQTIIPKKDLFEGGWGGLGLGLRYEEFHADEDVYENIINKGNSVRKADAFSIALNWFLNPHAKLILDYTRTTFDVPLLVYRDSVSSTAFYSDTEDVFTLRLQFLI